MAFAAFSIYRDQPALTRSTRAVAEEIRRTVPIVQNWSVAHGWAERADAWDKEQERKSRARLDHIERSNRDDIALAEHGLRLLYAHLPPGMNFDTFDDFLAWCEAHAND